MGPTSWCHSVLQNVVSRLHAGTLAKLSKYSGAIPPTVGRCSLTKCAVFF